MKISFISPEITNAPAKTALVLPIFDKGKKSPSFNRYNKGSKNQLSAAVKAAGVDGRKGKSATILAPLGTKINRIVIAGAGKRENFDSEKFAARMTKSLLMSGETSLVFDFSGLEFTPVESARAAVGARLAAYRFDKYRTTLSAAKKPSLKNVKIADDAPTKARAAYKKFYGPVVDGTVLARDLVMEPANKLYPKSYAARIKKLDELGLKVEVLGEKRMATLGMNALLAVGKGSARESQLVVMRWNGGKSSDKPVCLIGKGVTFDTGGISLKPGAGMWDMKGDMGGSAAVVGAMRILAARKAKANVVGIVGLVENMPDGLAQNPGDIVTSMSGQTIEVQNTDAEGRLVLCDALHYAKTRFKPKCMVDLATLTGAIIISLGHENAGLFSNDDGLAEQILAAGDASTESVWRMPLGPNYDKLLDSPNADMKNIGGRAAGSISAAQFLKRFVGDTPWAHIDIAGTAWKSGSKDPREPAWATGFGARLLNRWIADNFEG